MTTRRERRRAATVQEIKAAALDLLEAEGPPGLSIRALARAIDMSPAGLYRYFDGLDALITELIVDAYNDLADAVEAGISAAANRTAAEQFAAGAAAYRSWSVANRGRFLLLFGTPIPGYAAPEGGPTVAANRRIGEAFFRVAAQGWAMGEMRVPEGVPSEGDRELAAQVAQETPGFPAELVPVLLGTWAHFHGLVTLEILNQLDWIYPDAASFYEGEVARMVAALTG